MTMFHKTCGALPLLSDHKFDRQPADHILWYGTSKNKISHTFYSCLSTCRMLTFIRVRFQNSINFSLHSFSSSPGHNEGTVSLLFEKLQLFSQFSSRTKSFVSWLQVRILGELNTLGTEWYAVRAGPDRTTISPCDRRREMGVSERELPPTDKIAGNPEGRRRLGLCSWEEEK